MKVLEKCLCFMLNFPYIVRYSTDPVWVLHNKRWIYYSTITVYSNFLFTALNTPEIITLE
jgi:hypothetical protein